MAAEQDIRYQGSANLFKFCKEALYIKHGSEVKIMDQHVGGILKLDPADCCHWKWGKRNFRSTQKIETLATYLDTDPKMLIDIVNNRINIDDAIYEYKGYGDFNISTKLYENIKKDFARNKAKKIQNDKTENISDYTELMRDETVSVIENLLNYGQIESSPIMLSEIEDALTGKIKIIYDNNLDVLPLKTVYDNQKLIIYHKEAEMKTYLRFLIAKEIGKILLNSFENWNVIDEVKEARLNIFAMHLLIPTRFFKNAVNTVLFERDLVEQLSEIFWVGRNVINARLKDYILNGN